MRRTVKKMIHNALRAKSRATSEQRKQSHYYCRQPEAAREAKKRERRARMYQWTQNLKALPEDLAKLYIKE